MDHALIAELKQIISVFQINPGFQYVDGGNAYATVQTSIPGTNGTVFIGLDLVKELLEPTDGGIAVVAVLAHECAHIFQLTTDFGKRFGDLQKSIVRMELHADCLAGYYLGKKLGTAGAGKLRPALQLMIKIGEYSANPPSHAAAGQRAAALQRGFGLASASLQAAAEDADKYVIGLL